MREGYRPFCGSITRVREGIVEMNMAEVRGRLQKVEELGQKDRILRNTTEVERCEVQQIPPR